MLAWAYGTRSYPQWSTRLGIQEALQDRDDIGWMNFLEGCVASEWTSVQDRYYKSISSREDNGLLCLLRNFLTWHGTYGNTVMDSHMARNTSRSTMRCMRWIMKFDIN
jgi:hypothetical protein